MKSKEILNKYLNFYEQRGHKLIPNVSIVPENDPTLLYVNSGMFPLVPYLTGEIHPAGKRLMNVQRCLRFFEDLENIGITNRHTTAFHMLGNWSLGDYFKDQQLPWAYEFLIEVLGLDPNKMYATVFEGDQYAPKDIESIEIIKKIFANYKLEAKENERIFAYGRSDNWWKRGDAAGEPGGPDSEVFYYIGKEGTGLGLNPADNQDVFIEIGNSVFMQYKKTSEGGWEELTQKNVDFGGGLERLALAVQQKQDIYQTDNFWPIIEEIQNQSGKNYLETSEVTKSMRVLADHIRAATFLAMDGVTPSNKDQGYILRRLLRRMVRAGKMLTVEKDISVSLVPVIVKMFEWLYPELPSKEAKMLEIFSQEEAKFRKTLERGAREVEKVITKELNTQSAAKIAFDLYQSFGYPDEMFKQDLVDADIRIDEVEFDEEYKNLFDQHQQESRTGAEQKFKGGLADHSENTIKYHTATHLLHWALRQVLGDHVEQRGSNITGSRLRFDFSHKERLTAKQLAHVEMLMTQKISEGHAVGFEVLPKEEAQKLGAIAIFGEKYGETVKVYYLGDSLDKAFSREFCGGPHVSNLKELSEVEIYKQKSLGNEIQRIYAKWKE